MGVAFNCSLWVYLIEDVFAEIFVIVLISDVTFIMKFKKLNNCVNENFP